MGKSSWFAILRGHLSPEETVSVAEDPQEWDRPDPIIGLVSCGYRERFTPEVRMVYSHLGRTRAKLTI